MGLIEMKRQGIDPIKEHFNMKEKLDFPINPAFLKVSLNDKY